MHYMIFDAPEASSSILSPLSLAESRCVGGEATTLAKEDQWKPESLFEEMAWMATPEFQSSAKQEDKKGSYFLTLFPFQGAWVVLNFTWVQNQKGTWEPVKGTKKIPRISAGLMESERCGLSGRPDLPGG